MVYKIFSIVVLLENLNQIEIVTKVCNRRYLGVVSANYSWIRSKLIEVCRIQNLLTYDSISSYSCTT